MEGGGGSGNKTTGGLAGFFGAGGAGYSHADLAGVPLTGMNPLSPYLNVDPRYLVQLCFIVHLVLSLRKQEVQKMTSTQ
uniref:Mitochondrial import inner membrane translocase subunit Tim23 n=1 Tax=Marmota marmota marmota TaxID=9994 RepID=A0A8C6EX30_MARMA